MSTSLRSNHRGALACPETGWWTSGEPLALTRDGGDGRPSFDGGDSSARCGVDLPQARGRDLDFPERTAGNRYPIGEGPRRPAAGPQTGRQTRQLEAEGRAAGRHGYGDGHDRGGQPRGKGGPLRDRRCGPGLRRRNGRQGRPPGGRGRTRRRQGRERTQGHRPGDRTCQGQGSRRERASDRPLRCRTSRRRGPQRERHPGPQGSAGRRVVRPSGPRLTARVCADDP